MRQALRDLAALVARVGVGGIFFANGWRKLEIGLAQTGIQFQSQGAPAPRAWATITMMTELIGGALLIAGLLVSVMGLILFAEAVAVLTVAPPLNPITVNELILLGATSLLLAVVGAGRLSVDHMVVIRRRESEAAGEFAADQEADAVIASLRDPDAPPRPSTPSHPTTPSRPATAPEQADDPAPPPRTPPRTPPAAKGAPAARGKPSAEPAPDDTAPHPRPGRTNPDPAGEPGSSPGDTLVAGRKKPPTRGRRTTSAD
ncbi:DoxX family membrane protein [Nonomuraea sp. NPDC023979]|uniref:DoxX family protein n=1 Tax=Nonomuraea sp. NPDC023979 TaxID=3154796 RepID=UPI0033E72E20